MGYRHIAELLAEMDSQELSGWIEYLRIDERVQADWATHAIIKAFRGNQQANAVDDDEEEVIDTTKPEFAQHFKGFVGKPGDRQLLRQ